MIVTTLARVEPGSPAIAIVHVLGDDGPDFVGRPVKAERTARPVIARQHGSDRRDRHDQHGKACDADRDRFHLESGCWLLVGCWLVAGRLLVTGW
ncbi:MAG: hypothetical protein DMF99_31625 [Acidobacteria bacterium]|nr:MAG: hypothetical protein DMF99_31625 [Acidobacteriota bacterium]